jgi:hypothetical protein
MAVTERQINPLRVLARTGGKVADMESVGHATDGNGLTAADAAALCAGVPDYCLKAALMKWAGAMDHWLPLERKLWMAAVDMSVAEKWKLIPELQGERMGVLRLLCRLAIAEHVRPQQFRTSADRRRYIGIKNDAWRRTWKTRYEVIYRVFDDWTMVVYRQIQRNQADDQLSERVA